MQQQKKLFKEYDNEQGVADTDGHKTTAGDDDDER